MSLQVNEACAPINNLAVTWKVLDALMGGTRTMRAAGHTLMPRWPAEDIDAHKARVETATLFPAYRRTVSVMSGKPFAKPLALRDSNSDFDKWAEDIDLQGMSLNNFAAEMFAEVVGYGLAGILVDFPRVDGTETTTRAALEATGARPYWVRVKHHQILGWQAQIQSGKMRLTQLRILETYEQADGLFATKWLPQVRVLSPGAWEIWREDADGKGWGIFDKGTTTLEDIPYVPLYGIRDGFMIGRAPLEDLAYLNVKHWQSQSDQDTIMHVARVPILALSGADDDTKLSVGAATAVKLPQGAKLEYVEHTGQAIGAGVSAINALEEQMIQTGAELMVKKPGARTATESANDAEANKSDLQRMAEQFEDAIDLALHYTAQWAKQSTVPTAKLFSDYGAATMGEASGALIKDLHLSGVITSETAIVELQRRGILSDDVDPAVEAANAEAEMTASLPPAPMAGAGAETNVANG
ncbi:DUF4055 domain-containing protein [Dyella caseinilytica]|uniref:DUF4055 domain-containing protein n=1 Tax=Dyella caseinilytica TaxID=1849581 RepID=A0ABX7GSZ9_9GAMM|nr:DUF4055 domain-containing protein [Dyella caseinilytica]QRN52400.1 DUF4055 domain-containing protein [Dyella caseinilytica]GGA05671.1 DNA-binding protein [Dyella caseinilytica]